MGLNTFCRARTSYLVAGDESLDSRQQIVVLVGELVLGGQRYYFAGPATQADSHLQSATMKLCSVSLHAAIECLREDGEEFLFGTT